MGVSAWIFSVDYFLSIFQMYTFVYAFLWSFGIKWSRKLNPFFLCMHFTDTFLHACTCGWKHVYTLESYKVSFKRKCFQDWAGDWTFSPSFTKCIASSERYRFPIANCVQFCICIWEVENVQVYKKINSMEWIYHSSLGNGELKWQIRQLGLNFMNPEEIQKLLGLCGGQRVSILYEFAPKSLDSQNPLFVAIIISQPSAPLFQSPI